MRLVLHSKIPNDVSLGQKWNDLVHQMECPEVFYTYEWALAVSRAYDPVIKPLLFLAYDGDLLTGVAAFARKGAEDRASFLASFTADYCDLVSHPSRRAEFLKNVLAELRTVGVDTVHMANLPGDSATRAALAERASHYGYSVFSRPAYQCAQVPLRSPEERNGSKHSIQRKQMVRRHLKGMSKIGPVTVRHSESWQEIEPLMATFTRTHVARFLDNGKISNLAHPERRLFLNELGRLLSARGWIRMTCLMVGKTEAAWNYGFLFAGNWFWYQPTFDSNFRPHYPGYCLLAKIVEEACDDPKICRVDMGLGDEAYKNKILTAVRQTFDMTVTSSKLRYSKGILRYKITSTMKRFPVLEKQIRKSMGRPAIRSGKTAVHFTQYSKSLYRQIRDGLFSQEEVLFFEWRISGFPGLEASDTGSFMLQSVDLDLLAVAIMNYVDDQDSVAYFLRAAERLRRKDQGLALVTDAGLPVHFCWLKEATADEACAPGVDHYAKVASSNAVLFYDNWTPGSVRARDHDRQALYWIASQLHADGKAPWTFVPAANVAFLRQVRDAGFTHAFTCKQSRVCFTRHLSLPSTGTNEDAAEIGSAA